MTSLKAVGPIEKHKEIIELRFDGFARHPLMKHDIPYQRAIVEALVKLYVSPVKVSVCFNIPTGYGKNIMVLMFLILVNSIKKDKKKVVFHYSNGWIYQRDLKILKEIGISDI